jgi:hypothetical protein
MNFKVLTLFLFFIACKNIIRPQPKLPLSNRNDFNVINPNTYSFHCDSIINEKDIEPCLSFLYAMEAFNKHQNEIKNNNYNIIVSYRNKYAMPYCLTVNPSLSLYKISCDSIYKNKYLGSIVIFAPTSEGRTNFIFTYIDYGYRQYIDLHKDASNKYFIDSWMVARGRTW